MKKCVVFLDVRISLLVKNCISQRKANNIYHTIPCERPGSKMRVPSWSTMTTLYLVSFSKVQRFETAAFIT